MNGKFVIKEPCHENWNVMTQVEKGRFCDACAKCVFDLTQKTQTEIKEIYDENEGNVCGHMKLSQLTDQPKVATLPGFDWRKPLKRIQLFAAAMFAAFAFMISGSAKAQTKHQMVKGKVAYHRTSGPLEGTVSFEGGEPIANISVQVKQGEVVLLETYTDRKGRYSFTEMNFGDYTIVVASNGYVGNKKPIKMESRGTTTLNFTLQEMVVLGMMIYEPELPPIEVTEEFQLPFPEEVEEEVYIDGGLSFEPYLEIPLKEITCGTAVLRNDGEAEMETEAEGPIEGPVQIELTKGEMLIFPNPTKDQLNITLIDVPEGEGNVYLLDMNGKILQKESLHDIQKNGHSLDLGAYDPGIYLLRIELGADVYENKVLRL